MKYLVLAGALALAYFSLGAAVQILRFAPRPLTVLCVIVLLALGFAALRLRAHAFMASGLHRLRGWRFVVFLFLGAAPVSCLISGCSTSGVTQFATNATTAAAAIGTVNNALIQLNVTTINNLSQLSQALLKVNCPVTNTLYSLGQTIAADPAVAANVKAFLTQAGPAGALQSDICTAAGLGPTSTPPADAVVAPAS